MVTGVIGIVIVALAVIAIRQRHRYPSLLPLVPIMVGSLLLQSGMGAWAVKYPQSAPILALHFGFSLVAVAGVFLVMRVIGEQQGDRRKRKPAPPALYTYAVWASVVMVYIVAYSGAYMKHTNAESSCKTWPLCDGQVFPGWHGADGAVFMHRLAAFGGLIFISGIAWLGYRIRFERPDLYNVSMLSLLLVFAQALVGMLVVRTDMQLVSTLLHAGMMAALFLSLCEGCRLTLPYRELRLADRQSVAGHPSTSPAD
jgi:cytochrome c oxidase assembly protein subunit 15